MFATAGFGGVFAGMSVPSGQDNKSEQIETENGTGYEPAPKRFPIVVVKLLEHFLPLYLIESRMSTSPIASFNMGYFMTETWYYPSGKIPKI